MKPTVKNDPDRSGQSELAVIVPGTPEGREIATYRSKAIATELSRRARVARTPRPATSGGGGFAVRQRDRVFSRAVVAALIIVLIIPTIGSAVYLWLIADNQFITEARFSVESSNTGASMIPSGLMSLLDSGQAKDGEIIAEYVRSRSMLEELEKTIDLKKIFRPNTYDLIAHLPARITAESMLDYWRRQIDINVQAGSGLVTLKVRAFTPQDSLEIAKLILNISEKTVNNLTRSKEEDEFRRDTDELERARQNLRSSVASLRDARNEAGIIDANVAATAYNNIITSLQIEASNVDQSLDVMARSKTESSPQVAPLKARSEALHAQIAAYKAAIAGNDQSDPANAQTFATKSSQLIEKETDLSIARSQYAAAMVNFEHSRTTLERQRAYLLVYVPPQMAEKALYPARLTTWLEISFAAFVLWAAIFGVAVLIRDNMA